MTKSEPVEPGGLSLLRDIGDLAARVRVREQTLQRFIARAASEYNVYTIRPNGKPRKIESPRGVLKQIQQRIARYIANTERFPSYVCGGVAGRSIIDHARLHVGKPLVVTMDVAKCYPSTQTVLVREGLRIIGVADEVAEAVTALCTFDGHLPTGAPTSSYLLNVAWRPIDDALLTLFWPYGPTYSRYMDDLAVSGPKALVGISRSVASILSSFGYRLGDGKTHEMPHHKPQIVTSLLVNDRVRPTPKFTADLKRLIRRCWEEDLERVADEEDCASVQALHDRIEGRLRFVRSVDRKLGHDIHRLYYRISWPWRGSAEDVEVPVAEA